MGRPGFLRGDAAQLGGEIGFGTASGDAEGEKMF